MTSPKMTQQQIDALLKDSMFSDEQINEPRPPKEEESNQYGQDQFESYQESLVGKSRTNMPATKKLAEEDSYQYGSEQFQSYEESRNTFKKSAVKTDPKFGKGPANSKKLTDIKQQASPQVRSKEKKADGSKEKPRPKTGIYFYPPKQHSSVPPSGDKKYLPHNYARLQQREKQLLLTTLTEQNRHLKEDLKAKDESYQKLDRAYKALLQQKAHHATSVREATLEKQLSALQSRHQKLQNLCKLEKQKHLFKTAKTSQGFVASEQASQRQEQLLDIIDKLKDRLMSTDSELRVLQKKMGEGEDYIDELKRKMKRVEQLEFKIQKMTDQAENDRQYIQHLKNNNSNLENQIFELQKEKRLMEVEIRRYQLGQATQSDTMAQLQEVKKEKEKLESNLRQLTMNMTSLNKNRSKVTWGAIQDSGELLKP